MSLWRVVLVVKISIFRIDHLWLELLHLLNTSIDMSFLRFCRLWTKTTCCGGKHCTCLYIDMSVCFRHHLNIRMFVFIVGMFSLVKSEFLDCFSNLLYLYFTSYLLVLMPAVFYPHVDDHWVWYLHQFGIMICHVCRL